MSRRRFGVVWGTVAGIVAALGGVAEAGPARYDPETRSFKFTYTYASLVEGQFGDAAIGAPQKPQANEDDLVRRVVLKVSDALSKATAGRAKIQSLDFVPDVKRADIVISLSGKPSRGGWAIAGAIEGRPGQIGLYYQTLAEELEQDIVLTAAHEVCHYVFGLVDEYTFPQGCPVANPGGPGCLMDNYLTNGSRHGWYGRFCDGDHVTHQSQPTSCQVIVNDFFKARKVNIAPAGPSESADPPAAETQVAGRQSVIDNLLGATVGKVREEVEARDRERKEKGRSTALFDSGIREVARKFFSDQLKINKVSLTDQEARDLAEFAFKEAVSVAKLAIPPQFTPVVKVISRFAEAKAKELKEKAPKDSESARKTKITASVLKFVAELGNAPTAGKAPTAEERKYLESLVTQAMARVDSNTPDGDQLAAILAGIKLNRETAGNVLDIAGQLGIPGMQNRNASISAVDADLRKFIPGRTASTGFGRRRTIVVDPDPLDPKYDFIVTQSGIYSYSDARSHFNDLFRKLVERAQVEVLTTKLQERRQAEARGQLGLTTAARLRKEQEARIARLANVNSVRSQREADLRAAVNELIADVQKNLLENIVLLVPPGGIPRDLAPLFETLRRELIIKTDVRLDVVLVGAADIPFEVRDIAVGTGGSIVTLVDFDETGSVAQRLKNDQATGSWVTTPQRDEIQGAFFALGQNSYSPKARWLVDDPRRESTFRFQSEALASRWNSFKVLLIPAIGCDSSLDAKEIENQWLEERMNEKILKELSENGLLVLSQKYRSIRVFQPNTSASKFNKLAGHVKEAAEKARIEKASKSEVRARLKKASEEPEYRIEGLINQAHEGGILPFEGKSKLIEVFDRLDRPVEEENHAPGGVNPPNEGKRDLVGAFNVLAEALTPKEVFDFWKFVAVEADQAKVKQKTGWIAVAVSTIFGPAEWEPFDDARNKLMEILGDQYEYASRGMDISVNELVDRDLFKENLKPATWSDFDLWKANVLPHGTREQMISTFQQILSDPYRIKVEPNNKQDGNLSLSEEIEYIISYVKQFNNRKPGTNEFIKNELTERVLRARRLFDELRQTITIAQAAHEPFLPIDFNENAILQKAYDETEAIIKELAAADTQGIDKAARFTGPPVNGIPRDPTPEAIAYLKPLSKRWKKGTPPNVIQGELLAYYLNLAAATYANNPATFAYLRLKQSEAALRIVHDKLDQLERDLAALDTTALFRRMDRQGLVRAIQMMQDKAPGFIAQVPGEIGRPPLQPFDTNKEFDGKTGYKAIRLQRFYAENQRFDPTQRQAEFELVLGLAHPLPGVDDQAIRENNRDRLPVLRLYNDNGLPSETPSLQLDRDASTPNCLIYRFSPEFGETGWYTAALLIKDSTLRVLGRDKINITFSVASSRPNFRLTANQIQLADDPELVPPPPRRGLARAMDRRVRVEVQVYGGTSILNAQIRGVMFKIDEGTQPIVPVAQDFHDDGETYGDRHKNDGVYTTLIPLDQVETNKEYRLLIQADSTPQSQNIAPEDPNGRDEERRKDAKNRGEKDVRTESLKKVESPERAKTQTFQRATSIQIRVQQ